MKSHRVVLFAILLVIQVGHALPLAAGGPKRGKTRVQPGKYATTWLGRAGARMIGIGPILHARQQVRAKAATAAMRREIEQTLAWEALDGAARFLRTRQPELALAKISPLLASAPGFDSSLWTRKSVRILVALAKNYPMVQEVSPDNGFALLQNELPGAKKKGVRVVAAEQDVERAVTELFKKNPAKAAEIATSVWHAANNNELGREDANGWFRVWAEWIYAAAERQMNSPR